MHFDIYTLIFAGLAIFVVIKLKSVLGTRTGQEKPPVDPFAPREPGAPNGVIRDNVVPLPRNGEIASSAPETPPVDRWAGVAPAGSDLARGLDEVASADESFDLATFQSGAKSAYEWIVSAFARGDRKALRDLLSKEVFDNFANVIAGREQRGETAETTFVSIDKSELTHAGVKDGSVLMTVRFVSKIISATKDRSGAVVEGNPELVTDVIDVWTFSREVRSRDPNWKLVATQSGG